MRCIASVILVGICLICAKICAGQPEVGSEVTVVLSGNNTDMVKVQEVDYGKNVKLSCRSNDEGHFFLFWELANDEAVVGPANNYDTHKYDYEILSGNLIIRGVSRQEEGVYRCVSRGVRNDDINIRAVNMVVKRSPEEVVQHDPGVNYFRGVLVVGFLVIAAGVVYYIYSLRKRHRLQHLLEEDEEEDSAEEIFRAPGTSREPDAVVVVKEDDLVEVPKISIDFEDILNTSQSHK